MKAFLTPCSLNFDFSSKNIRENYVLQGILRKKKKNFGKKTTVFSGIFFSDPNLLVEPLFSYEPFSLKKRLEGFLKAKKDISVLSIYLPGNFNNHNQHLTDLITQKKETPPHEHIHCFIEKLNSPLEPKQVFLAKYFFPFPSPKIFRIRLYIIYPCEFSTKERPVTKMEIIRNSEESWGGKKKGYPVSKKKTIKLFENGTSLSNCIIFWEKTKEIGKKASSLRIFQGFMENQGCTILTNSSFSFLHVNDNLVLSPHSFWVNDRGFKEDGNLLYGNKEGVSFQMERMKTGNFLHWSFGENFPKQKLN